MKTGWKIFAFIFVFLLGVEVYALWKLIRLHDTIISVINVSDETLFNAPPNREMIAGLGEKKFYYRIPSPYLDRYRRELVSVGLKTVGGDWERALAVARWVRQKLKYATPADFKGYFVRDWPALAVLESSGDLRGLCDSYARIFTIGCLSLGIPARSIWLNDHWTAEVFLTEQQRWVMIDPTYAYFIKINDNTACCLDIHKYYQDNSSQVKWEPVVFDATNNDGIYRKKREGSLRFEYLDRLYVVDAHYSLLTPSWRNYFKIYRAINWVDENTHARGIWEYRLRWVVGINFLILVVLLVCLLKMVKLQQIANDIKINL